jgi:hypothetical protein
LYHEAAAVGLLETVLFHEDGAQCISEVMIDLLDYAVDQLTALLGLIKSVFNIHTYIHITHTKP